jgi:hypothetical protein
MSRKIFIALVLAAFSILAVLMTVNSFLARDWDFQVYYRTIHHLLHSEPVYSFARDGGSSYKYPPWITPLFLPFSILPEPVANVVWRLLQVLSALFVVRWVSLRLKNPWNALLAAVVFYGIFMINILTGQIQWLLLAITLFSSDLLRRHPLPGFFGVFFGLSAKVFNLFALLGLPKGSIRPRAVIWTLILAGLLGLPVLAGYAHFNPLEALRAYAEAAGSKTGNLGGAKQGFPYFWMFLFRLDENSPLSYWSALGLSFASLAAYFLWIRKRIGDESRSFALSLALGAAVHPLAFSYSFSWVYPLAAFAIEGAFFSGPVAHQRRWLAGIGLIFSNLITSGMIADHWPLPPFGPRSIGVILLGLSLVDSFDTPVKRTGSAS